MRAILEEEIIRSWQNIAYGVESKTFKKRMPNMNLRF